MLAREADLGYLVNLCRGAVGLVALARSAYLLHTRPAGDPRAFLQPCTRKVRPELPVGPLGPIGSSGGGPYWGGAEVIPVVKGVQHSLQQMMACMLASTACVVHKTG